MMIKMRPVTVHQVPEQVTATEERTFLRELQEFVDTDRPRLVLDCSRLRLMDDAAIHLLLSCLEEAMKRKGDVKLASLRPGAEAMLRFSGAYTLFETYRTTSDAVRSYRERPGGSILPSFDTGELPGEAESAA
ncbi:MAG TPA: STAS domain-containing protein [Acidobacteriaceae bacterium]|jgi:anti-anti-sigma factor|nr:STAS domain-containing protein [Acidobacteriaceae bacterium]